MLKYECETNEKGKNGQCERAEKNNVKNIKKVRTNK